MSDSAEKFIKVGTFGRPYSIHGWIKVHSATQPPKAIIQYQPWYIQKENGEWELLNVDNLRINQNNLVVHLEDINDPESAQLLTNKTIGIPYKKLPKLSKGEYYWADLIGMTVINEEDVNLGIIDHLLDTPANDVLVVLGKKRHLIPFIKDHTIKSVDMQKKIIRVDWDADF